MIVDYASRIKGAWLAESADAIGGTAEPRRAEARNAVNILGRGICLGACGAALGVLCCKCEDQSCYSYLMRNLQPRRNDTNHVVDGVGKRVAVARRVVQRKHGRGACRQGEEPIGRRLELRRRG